MPDPFPVYPAYLLIAIALLWMPRSWLRTGKRLFKKRRKPDDAIERLAGMGADDPENKSVKLGREFSKSRNYVDFLRAMAGGYTLGYYPYELTKDAAADLLKLQAVVLIVAALIQSIRYEKKVSFYAPIFFYLGMSSGFAGNHIFAFSLAVVMAINTIIPNPRWFLTLFGLGALPVSYYFHTDLKVTGLLTGCILLGPLLSLLTGRPLVVFTRKRRSSSGSS